SSRTATLIRLAVGMTRSASRKKLSPVSRCLTPMATLPLWALARAVRRPARASSCPPPGRSRSRVAARFILLGLQKGSGPAALLQAGEEVRQVQPEPRQHRPTLQVAALADVPVLRWRGVDPGRLLPWIDHPR